MQLLSPESIEHIHDVLVGVFLPFDEKVNPAEYRNREYIESAAARPYQTAFGADAYPTLAAKAAALFHSLVCNHCFINGNKRTAVIALDIFVMLNNHILTMAPNEIYDMARATANANLDGRPHEEVLADLTQRIGVELIDINIFDDPDLQKRLGGQYESIAKHVQRIVSFTQTMLKVERAANGET